MRVHQDSSSTLKDAAFASARNNVTNAQLFAINLAPGGATADAIDRGDYLDASISFVSDVALLGLGRLKAAANSARGLRGAEQLAELDRIGKLSVRFQRANEGIGAVRLTQGGFAAIQGENGQAAGHFGEALLRIFGVRFAKPDLSTRFDLNKPFATGREMVTGIKELERGFKGLPGNPLSSTHKLTPFQANALRENVRAVINNTVNATKSGQTRRGTTALQSQLQNPRFRFLNQVPDAKAALEEAIRDLDVTLPK